eukprot:jgi/Astpho2/3114/fgenesh1_pg.00051_%23_86_t
MQQTLPLKRPAPRLQLSVRRSIFAVEFNQRGSRGFVVSTHEAFWKRYQAMLPQHRHCYEIIRESEPCHLYFDLEFSRLLNRDLDGQHLTDNLLDLVQQHLKATFDVDLKACQINPDGTAQAEQDREAAPSSAGPPQQPSELAATEPMLPLPGKGCGVLQAEDEQDDAEALELVAALESKFVSEAHCRRTACHERLLVLKDAGGAKTSFADLGVYTRNRAFRLFLSSKAGKQSILMPTGVWRQRCYDEECSTYQSPAVPVPAAVLRFKIIINLATAALGVLAELFAVFKFGSTAVDAIIPVFTVGRILEAAKDVVLLFTTGSTIWYKGFSTPEHAVRFDRVAKYVTCLTISLVLSATSFYGFALRPDAIGHWWLLLLGLVGGVDFALGLYIVILDECVREHYLARERPNEFQVDVHMEEGDPFNEGEDSAAVGLSTRPPIAERFPTVVQMKDKRAKLRGCQRMTRKGAGLPWQVAKVEGPHCGCCSRYEASHGARHGGALWQAANACRGEAVPQDRG